MTTSALSRRSLTADAALARVRSGQHVLVGSGAAQPGVLVEALARRGAALSDVEILHLLTLGAAPYAGPEFEGRLRHNALFIGPNVRGAVERGLADYTPCFLFQVPRLLRAGRLPLDVALIQVTPPRGGFCSLGVSVDILKAAVESADYVVAQVNPRMPWTGGDSLVRVEDIDAFVEGERPLLELPEPAYTAAALWIGRYVATLIEDGSTLQMGIGAIPNAVLAALGGKKDLGVHSEMISDGVLPLMRSGVINGRAKTLHRGKVVTSFCAGTQRLYDAVDGDPAFEFRPSDYVNSPDVIGRNAKMVAINSALQVDLTGQVAADSIGHRFYSGFGGQVDFMRGAALSEGGKAIIALPSTAKGGKVSRISLSLVEGTGVVTTRADVDFVVTEYGIASLKGKTIRERAIALIQIAHPDFRGELLAAAKRVGYLDAGRVLPLLAERYPAELEARMRFRRDEVFFRPVKPSDLRRLKDLFYSQSERTTYLRYGIPLAKLSEAQFQQMVAIDFRAAMAVAGFVRDGRRERMIAVARYHATSEGRAEAAFTVEDRYQGQGIGTFLVDYLAWIARERGLRALTAQVLHVNARMRRIIEGRFEAARERELGDGVELEVRLDDWKGRGDPRSARTDGRHG